MSVTTPSIGSGAPAASDHHAVRYLGLCVSSATIPTIVMKTLGAPHRDCECGEESQKLSVEDVTSAVRHCNRVSVLPSLCTFSEFWSEVENSLHGATTTPHFR